MLPAGTVSTGGMGGGVCFGWSALEAPESPFSEEGWLGSEPCPLDLDSSSAGFAAGGCTVEGASGISCEDCEFPAGGFCFWSWPCADWANPETPTRAIVRTIKHPSREAEKESSPRRKPWLQPP